VDPASWNVQALARRELVLLATHAHSHASGKHAYMFVLTNVGVARDAAPRLKANLDLEELPAPLQKRQMLARKRVVEMLVRRDRGLCRRLGGDPKPLERRCHAALAIAS
jgi:hypothetical protein